MSHPKLNAAERAVVAMLARNGFQHPVQTLLASRDGGLNLAECIATLVMETGTGVNEFGHDPGNPVQGGIVTKDRYHLMRRYVSAGYPSQGAGPCQLTSTGLQDEADHLGGCWVPYFNMVVGFRFQAGLGNGVWSRFYHYNGSGPMAAAYATKGAALTALWRRRLKHARRKR